MTGKFDRVKTITIKEIAAKAGVSIKTVSRVLNGEPNVRRSTQEKVQKIARELRYTPNVSARSLASNKSYVIVHLYDNPNRDYISKIYMGTHKACRRKGYFVVQEPVAKPYVKSIGDFLTQFRVDGMILSPPICDDLALLDLLKAHDMPFVRLSPRISRELSSSCFIDDAAAAQQITEHLIAKGHRHIAHISGPDEHQVSALRLKGFHAALKGSGIDPADCPVLKGDFTARSGTELSEQILRSHKSVTAIFAANDDMAVGAIMGTQKSGKMVPNDISIVGFDGSRIGEVVWPRLTTMSQPIEDMAEKASEILLSELSGSGDTAKAIAFDVALSSGGTVASR